MIYAKWTEPLLGGEWAKKGTMDDPLPKQVDPNGFGPNDLEADASMVLKPTRPTFNITENVTTLDTKPVTLWTASDSASQTVEEYRNCSVEKASKAERADPAMLMGHQVRASAAKKAPGCLKLDGLGDIGVVVLRAAECVAALLRHISFGWNAVLRDSGQAASIKASPSATTLLSWIPRWRKCSCRNSCKAGQGPNRSDAFRSVPRTSRRSHHHGCTRGLGQSFQKRSCKLWAPHRSVNQNSQRHASRVPERQDGDLQRRETLSCSSWKAYSLNVAQKVLSSRLAGAGSKLTAAP